MIVRYSIDEPAVLAALARIPAEMDKQLNGALDRAALETAREMRRAAAERDVFGTLKNSIQIEKQALERFITPSVKYARFVEEGTGPAAGKARYFPNPGAILQFVTHSPRARGFDWARKGSKKRGDQNRELWFRSKALAFAIYMKGTKPHPFVAPTAAKMKSRFFAVMDEGVARGVGHAG